MRFPDLALGFHDVIISFDHHERRAWICSSGLPETLATKRFCKHCGAEVTPGNRFCTACGEAAA